MGCSLDVKKTELISEGDFKKHSLWGFDEESELYYPIFSLDEIPDEGFNFFIRAEFYTKSEISFMGYIVGVNRGYAISLFYRGKKYKFNKNIINGSIEQAEKLIRNFNDDRLNNVNDLFPLSYTTTIDIEPFNNITGKFDLFKEITDEERLAHLK